MNLSTEESMVRALTEMAAATRDLANATRQLAEQHHQLWLALPPRTRAKLLGVSPRTELRRRKQAEIDGLLRASA